MDQFLLANAAHYEHLVKRLNPASTGPNIASLTSGRRQQTHTGTPRTANPNMVVSARIRPFLDEDVAAGFPNAMFPRQKQKGIVDIHDLYNHPRGRPVLKSYHYEVDRLFDGDATTETIYEQLVSGLVPFAWNGGIATLFAYGQTGSGKTFTISRLEELVVEELMAMQQQKQHQQVDNAETSTPQPPTPPSTASERQISMTIIELAGNSVFDLLNARAPVAVRDDASGNTQLVGATEHPVGDTTQALELIDRAATFRRSAPTLKNAASSRSHAICRIRISNGSSFKHDAVDNVNGNYAANSSSSSRQDGLLYMIDLAGSEAARDVAVHGADRMREAREINMSLSVLKDCIRGRAEADAAIAAATAVSVAAAAAAATATGKTSTAPTTDTAADGNTSTTNGDINNTAKGSINNDKKHPAGTKPPRIPFRQAALTRILKHVFDHPTPAAAAADNIDGIVTSISDGGGGSGGSGSSGTINGCKTVVIACVNPSLADVGASKNTLRYAELLRVLMPTNNKFKDTTAAAAAAAGGSGGGGDLDAKDGGDGERVAEETKQQEQQGINRKPKPQSTLKTRPEQQQRPWQ